MLQCLALMIKRGLIVEGININGIKIYPWYPDKAIEILREAGYDELQIVRHIISPFFNFL